MVGNCFLTEPSGVPVHPALADEGREAAAKKEGKKIILIKIDFIYFLCEKLKHEDEKKIDDHIIVGSERKWKS